MRRSCLIVCSLVLLGTLPAHADALDADISGTPTILGTVRFHGTPPRPQLKTISKDPEVCGHGQRELAPVRVTDDGSLRDAVVYVESDSLDTPLDPPAEGYVLNQEGCRFSPYILIYPKDPRARLIIVNSDPTLHNVRIAQTLGRVNVTLLNLAQPKGGKPAVKSLRIKEGSHVLAVKCDAHDFMEGWIFAADNRYCAAVDDGGAFRLWNVPPGEHVVKAWHPYLGSLSRTVVVNEGENVELDFEFSAEPKQ